MLETLRILEAVSKTQEQGATETRTGIYMQVIEDRSRSRNAAIVFFETASSEILFFNLHL
jgi:hypothetical protein